MKVVSFSSTPLAGAPIRVANCASLSGKVETRHVDLKRWGIFPHDHVHGENVELTRELLEEADVIHLYNSVHLDCRLFEGINFRDYVKRKAVVWHFQSTPTLVAKQGGLSLQAIQESPIPKIVIAQYPERFLPEALVVPNVVPLSDEAYQPEPCPSIDICYAPTSRRSAWEDRWNTKGMPETVAILARLSCKVDATCAVAHDTTLDRVLAMKRRSRIILDEMVTGSYHLSALEGLAMSKLVACYLDARIDYVMRTVSGATEQPFVNVRLEDAYEVLRYLMVDPLAVEQIGRENREWMETYWSDQRISEVFHGMYQQLLDDPSRIRRQAELALDSPRSYLMAHSVSNRVHESRARLGSKGLLAACLASVARSETKQNRIFRFVNRIFSKAQLYMSLRRLEKES